MRQFPHLPLETSSPIIEPDPTLCRPRIESELGLWKTLELHSERRVPDAGDLPVVINISQARHAPNTSCRTKPIYKVSAIRPFRQYCSSTYSVSVSKRYFDLDLQTSYNIIPTHTVTMKFTTTVASLAGLTFASAAPRAITIPADTFMLQANVITGKTAFDGQYLTTQVCRPQGF